MKQYLYFNFSAFYDILKAGNFFSIHSLIMQKKLNIFMWQKSDNCTYLVKYITGHVTKHYFCTHNRHNIIIVSIYSTFHFHNVLRSLIHHQEFLISAFQKHFLLTCPATFIYKMMHIFFHITY